MSWEEIGETTLYQARMLQKHYSRVSTAAQSLDMSVRIATHGKSGYYPDRPISETRSQSKEQSTKVQDLIAGNLAAQEFLAQQTK